LELVYEPARSRQADAQTLAGGITIAHRQLDIGNPWAIIAGHDLDTAAPLSFDATESHQASACIAHDVARYLRNGGGD
jgi:hypothetical protein